MLAQELEITTRLQLDHVEVVTAEELAELLEPVGDIEVDLPNDVTDASGATVAEAGASTIDAEQAAAILTARGPRRAGGTAVPGRCCRVVGGRRRGR